MACELCNKLKKTVGHHAYGYDKSDTWQICYSCNGLLADKKFHKGLITKEEAIQYIMERLDIAVGKIHFFENNRILCGHRRYRFSTKNKSLVSCKRCKNTVEY